LIEGVPSDGVPVHFEIRYYPKERYAEITLTSCGVEYTAITTALFNPDCADEPFDTVRFYMLNSAVVTVRLDNVKVYTVK
jgi:hypothetical protein